MGQMRTPTTARLWAAIGLLFVALLGTAPLGVASPSIAHVDHHVTADGHHDLLAFTDHAHIGATTTPGAPDAVGEVVAPRSRAAPVAVGLLIGTALLWGFARRHIPSVGRDPPRGPARTSPGREVLARLCISRR